MIKRMNTVFFSICFLAALLAETYCIQVLNGDLFSVVGIGIVVLLTGYLLLDSIRNQWKNTSEKTKFILEKIYQEETEKWNERYTDMINLQKATYTATKKNTAMLQEQLDDIRKQLEEFQRSNDNTMLKIADLQKKSLEGQKNALNLVINYNKENTKQIIKVLREEGEKIDIREQLKSIELLLEKRVAADFTHITDSHYIETGTNDRNMEAESENINTGTGEKAIDSDNINNGSDMKEVISPEDTNYEGDKSIMVTELDDEKTEEPSIVPLYDDPNKALTPDEIASLFASVGK